MKVVLLVALCCLLGMEVKVVSASNVFSDALNALTPSGCVVFSIASSNPISVITSFQNTLSTYYDMTVKLIAHFELLKTTDI